MSSTQIKSYVIYNPVYRSIKKYIKRQTGHRNFIVNTWNVCLYARDDILDMKLVWVRADSNQLIEFIDELVRVSDRCFPWHKFPNIVVPPEYYDGLKDFMGLNKLWNFVDKIETKTNIAVIRSTMKIITFHPRVREKSISFIYKQPLGFNFNGHGKNLYISMAYDWLKPDALKHFKTKIRYRYTHVVIYLLLDYYRTQRRRRNKRVLNLFDLCSLRLAMFDPRYYQFDQCEIPGLIHTELRHIIESEQKINKNYIFDPTEYLIQNGVHTAPPIVAEYFLFYVSSYTKIHGNIPSCSSFSSRINVANYVRLYTEDFYAEYLIEFIAKRPFLSMWIDGSKAPMGAHLILKIMSFQNVFELGIDTDFPTVLDDSESQEIDRFEDLITVMFCGENENSFMENCLLYLKNQITFRPFNLYIKCPVTDYSVFNDMPVCKIHFLRHELSAKMISELQKTELTEPRYYWTSSKLTNDPNVLEMLHKFPLVQEVEIVQDEYTFDLIFGFIEHQILENNLTEFYFNGSYVIRYKDLSGYEKKLKFNKYVFRLNEFRTKIEMIDRTDRKVVDLYEILNPTKSAEMEFDFYQ